jgi:hypothetical protein
MTTWVLILVITMGTGGTSVTMEHFFSERSCNAAGQVARELVEAQAGHLMNKLAWRRATDRRPRPRGRLGESARPFLFQPVSSRRVIAPQPPLRVPRYVSKATR